MAPARRNQVGVDLPEDLALVLRLICDIDEVTQPALLRQVLGNISAIGWRPTPT